MKKQSSVTACMQEYESLVSQSLQSDELQQISSNLDKELKAEVKTNRYILFVYLSCSVTT